MHSPIKTIFILSLTLVLILTGCKKNDKSPLSAKVKAKKTTSQSGLFPNDTISYTYDSQGRLTAQQGDYDVYTFSYSSGQVTENRNFNSTTIYHLNAQGYVTSDSKGYTYTYDVSGVPLSQTNQAGSVLHSSTVSNGDAQTSRSYNTFPFNTDTFTYYQVAEMRDYGTSFFGKSSAHLVQNETLGSAPGSTLSVRLVLAHSYEYDGQGRVSKESITAISSNPNVLVAEIVYDYY